MKRLTALSLLSVLAITGCACGAKQDTYTVDGFNDKTFKSYDEFKTYLINSGMISYKHTNNYWTINGVSMKDNAFNTEQEAINAFLNIFDPERYNVDKAIFDANGIATTIVEHIDTTTVYKKEDGEWTTSAREAYESYIDADFSGLYYYINANGIEFEDKNFDAMIQEFKNRIYKQDAVKISPIASTGVVEGDFITVNGTNYTWKNESYYTSTSSVTPMPGAYMEYNGLPYEYKIEHTYKNTTNSTPVPLVDGGKSGNGIDYYADHGDFLRIYSKDSTGRNQPFAGFTLTNVDYNDGIDYKWMEGSKKLVIDTDKYFKEDGKTYPADWTAYDCGIPIGHSKSIRPCFTEFQINANSGRVFLAREEETLRWDNFTPARPTPRTIRFTNVDNHALHYSVASNGRNRAGWYLSVKGVTENSYSEKDMSEFYSHPLSGATLYYDKSNTYFDPSKQLTTSFADSLTVKKVNPSGFYSPTFDFQHEAVKDQDYFAWNSGASYYPTSNALAGARQLTNDESKAYVVTDAYWWIGDAVHVTYNSLASAQAAAEQIVRTLYTSEWKLGESLDAPGVYTSKNSYEEAFNNFMSLSKIPTKIVENAYLDSAVRFEHLVEYTVINPTIVYKISGYDKYFDSKIDAFKWYRANVANPISYVLATDTYSAKGISAATQEELAKKIWDTYSKKVQ